MSELEVVYRERFAEFRRVAAAIVGDGEAARDVVQDGFGAAIRRRASFRREGPLEAWVWRTVVNTARDHRREADEAASRAAPGLPVPSQNGHSPLVDRVGTAISLLPERQRLALFLRYYADLDYAALADALDISPGTVAATLNAARAALRRTLQEVPQ